MKTFLTAMVIAAMLVVGGIAFNVCIDGISQELTAECDAITGLLTAEEFSSAAERIEALSDYIDRKKIILASVINHESIDDIELCISEIEGYTDCKMSAEALVRCRKLAHLFRHLPANYSITLQNIL